MPGHLAQISLPIVDPDRAEAFYRDVVGLKPLFRAGNLSFFDLNGVRLMLDKGEGEFTPPGSILYFKVTDIVSQVAGLKSKGATFRQEPHLVAKMPDHELWMAFFNDTEGNVLALMEEVRGGR